MAAITTGQVNEPGSPPKPPPIRHIPRWAYLAVTAIALVAAVGYVLYSGTLVGGPSGPPTYTLQGVVVTFAGNASTDFQRFTQLDSCPSTGSCGQGTAGVTLAESVGVGLTGTPSCSGPQYVITQVIASPLGAFNVTLPGPQLPYSLPFDHGLGCVWTDQLNLNVQIVARGPLVQPLNLIVTVSLA
jgi:hypothetical protein